MQRHRFVFVMQCPLHMEAAPLQHAARSDHHRQVHERRVVIERLDDGALRFVKPDGRTFESPKPGPMKPSKDWRQSPVAQHAPGTRINAKTATTRWRGERMDYDLAIESLCQRVAKRKNVPAGT